MPGQSNTENQRPRWVINRAEKFVGIARKGYMPHATVFDPGATGDPSRDRWTPEAEKFARVMRAAEEMYDALKAIDAKLEQIQRGTPNEAALLQEALSECAMATAAAEHDHELITLHTYAELEQLYRDKKATMPVDEINHREFVQTGWRYFCLRSSEADAMGWHVYKVEIEEVGTKA
jgi:alpha-L-arabinofuranosidase